MSLMDLGDQRISEIIQKNWLTFLVINIFMNIINIVFIV